VSELSTAMKRNSKGDASIALAEAPLTRVWNLRGDPSRTAFVAEAERLLGIALPLAANTSTRHLNVVEMLWTGPRAWLLVGGAGWTPPDLDGVRRALNAVNGALFDVSASYVAWSVAGPAAASVLNRCCPLDLHPRVFPAGHCAQSLLGHIGALFYRPDDDSRFIVWVARSFAADAWTQLSVAAMADGYGSDDVDVA